MDIGCYCVSLSRFLFAKEPVRVVGLTEYDPQLQTDRMASGIIDFNSGTSTFTCSTQLFPFQRVNILGTGEELISRSLSMPHQARIQSYGIIQKQARVKFFSTPLINTPCRLMLFQKLFLTIHLCHMDWMMRLIR